MSGCLHGSVTAWWEETPRKRRQAGSGISRKLEGFYRMINSRDNKAVFLNPVPEAPFSKSVLFLEQTFFFFAHTSP